MLTAILMLESCERSQFNYEKASPANRWVFHNTGKEMVWLGLAVVVLVVLGSRNLDPTNH